MNIFPAIIFSAASDAVLICAQILVLSVISEKRYSNIRLAAAAVTAAATGFVLDIFLFGWGENSAFLLLIFDCPRLCLLVLSVLKSLSLKDAMTAMTIQFLCSILNSAVMSLFPPDPTAEKPYINYITMITIPACMLVLAICFKRKTKNRVKIISGAASSIPVHTYICVFIAVFLEGGLIEVLSYDTDKFELQIRTVKILSLLLIICVTVLIISLAANVLYQKYYAGLNKILKEQVNSQLSHYEKREKINSEIQSFRHDFNNHIKCLESMMTAHKYDDAKAYIERISGMMPFGEFLFRTGNYISDAILTEAQENSAAANITIDFKGCIPQNIDSADLCIILSNSIRNAVEACSVLPENRNISVYGNCRQGIFVLIIKNPTVLVSCEKDFFPKTTKSDKESHGFGFSNMQYVVNKYEGTMHTAIENGFFILSITMKLQ